MTPPSHVRTALGLAALLLAFAPPRIAAAAGPTPSAAEEFRAGTESFKHGEFSKAAQLFEAAFHKSPKGAAVYNAAVAWEAAGDLPRAADAYDAALARKDLAPDQRTDAESKAQALAKKVATVEVNAPDGAVVTLEQVERAKAPVRVHVAPGAHDVRVELASGRAIVRHVNGAAGATVVLAIDEASPETAPPSAPEPAPTEPAPDASTAGAPAASPLPWIAIGGGVALVGLGAFLGAKGLSARDDFAASNDTDVDAHDRAVSMRTWANVSIVAGLAAGATGAVLLLTRKPEATTSAEVRVGPTGVAVRATF